MVTEQSTIYSTIPMQIFMINSIKKPIIDAVETLSSSDASKIDKVKAARKLWKAVHLISKMPEPTLESTWHPNSHNLIRLRDWLFERCFLGQKRMGLIRRLMNFVIILYDFDPPWRWVMDSLKDKAFEMEWKPKGYEDIRVYEWWKE